MKWLRRIFKWIKITPEHEEFCPHCGYYCTGKTIHCTKGLK